MTYSLREQVAASAAGGTAKVYKRSWRRQDTQNAIPDGDLHAPIDGGSAQCRAPGGHQINAAPQGLASFVVGREHGGATELAESQRGSGQL